MTQSRLAVMALALLAAPVASVGAPPSYTAQGSGPVAPQQPGQKDNYGQGNSSTFPYSVPATGGSNDRFADVDPGGSIIVDPEGGNWGAAMGPCRNVSNSSSSPYPVEIPLATPQEWLDFIAGYNTGTPPPGVTVAVCCRPAKPSDSFCSGGTVDSVGLVQGTSTNQYGQLASTGTATATCHDSSGSYTESHTYTCAVSGSGSTADGVWRYSSDSGDTCTSPPTITYGACSTAGVGGTGQQLVTSTDCLGNSTSLGYSGPSCYVAPPCQASYQYSCHGANYVGVDVSGCGYPNINAGTCTKDTYTYEVSCSIGSWNDCIPNACGGTTCYSDCKGQNWDPGGCPLDTTQCTPEGDVEVNCPGLPTTYSPGPSCARTSAVCTATEWVAP